MYLLGIDVGTTSLKAAVFDENGVMKCSHTIDYTLKTTDSYIEFDPEEYVRICREAIDKVSEGITIDALAVDTQGETLIVTDENGKPLRDAIVWLDNRAEKEAAAITADFGREKVYNITGQPEITAGWPASKLLWIKNNQPEIFKNIKKIFMLGDYLVYRLSGEFAADRTLQSSTVYFDIHTGDWWDEMLDYIGITRDMLPKLYDCGEAIGKFKNAVVAAGALDQIAGAVGAGIINSDIISEMTGTTMAICAVTDKLPPFNPNSIIPCHYHAIKGKYCLILWSPTAGMALKWFKNNFCENFSFRELDEMAEKLPAGSEGLVMLPYLCGSTMPRYNPSAQGVFFGATLNHTRAHFVRSVLEAVACMLKSNLDYLGAPCEEIRVMGGGATSKLWCKIKADMTGKRLATLKNTETACLGSAILAGVAAGVYSSVEQACEKLVATDKIYTPSGEDYSECYRRYTKLDERLNEWKGGLWE